VLGFAAVRNDDKVGLVLVAGEVEHFVPPGRGRSHVLRLLRDVLDATPRAGSDAARRGRAFVLRTSHRRNVVFWISDFEDARTPASGRCSDAATR
jgi:uncharacterized protein (DUF58 family)